MSSELNKKYKRPKKKTLNTTNPETSTSRPNSERHLAKHVCPLLAKDSEWVDILQTNDRSDPGPAPKSSNNGDSSDEEEVLQLVECENGPQSKPLAIMFPGLLDKDPQTLDGMLNRAMSTTEVTRQLVDLGQKANFSFMKKADRLIPTNKQWLESVTENSNSVVSLSSTKLPSGCFSDNYEAINETSVSNSNLPKKNKKTAATLKTSIFLRDSMLSEDTIDQEPEIDK